MKNPGYQWMSSYKSYLHVTSRSFLNYYDKLFYYVYITFHYLSE